MSAPLLVRGTELPGVLPGLEREEWALLAVGRPVCPACKLLPASLAAVAAARPRLALCVADMADAADWAVREPVLWPRGMRVSPASVPALFLLHRGRLVASRQGGAPAHVLDGWIAGHAGPADHPLAPGVTAGEQAVLDATAGRRVQHAMARGR